MTIQKVGREGINTRGSTFKRNRFYPSAVDLKVIIQFPAIPQKAPRCFKLLLRLGKSRTRLNDQLNYAKTYILHLSLNDVDVCIILLLLHY